jgi:hypothetical protein
MSRFDPGLMRLKEGIMKWRFRFSILFLGMAMILSMAAAQKVETVNGVQIVHNEKAGQWGNNPAVKLELVRTIGGLDADENLSFNAPYDIVLDSAGNMYILDTGNNRIQKLDPQGKFIKTIGRQGQGPGEFQGAFSLDIDEQDNLFVLEVRNMRIQVLSSEGRSLSTVKFDAFSMGQIRRLKPGLFVKGGSINLRSLMDRPRKLPKLLEIIDRDGRTIKTFGEATDYKDANVNSHANSFSLDTDAEKNICLSFWYQNRIDKYAADGTPLWRADRVLNYGTEVIDKGIIERSERGTSIQAPTMNMVSMGIAADGKGRIWVNTLRRQMSREEQGARVSVGGITRTVAEPKIEKMDVYKLEIYGPDGILLGEIPLNHHAHGLRIFGDNLFIWERNNTTYYQYKIIEK